MQRTIYVADDVPSNIHLVKDIFGRDKNLVIKEAKDGKDLLDQIKKNGLPDLILLDLMMPVMNGFDVLSKLKNQRQENYFPIIVISGLSEQQNIINALSLGADDYLMKPFFMDELRLKVNNMLKLKEHREFLNKSLDIMQADRLEKIYQLEQTQIEITKRLGMASEFRDNETGKHIERIADFAELMAKEIDMSREEKTMLKYAAPMHDVGKIGIPDQILLKPGKLTGEEFQIIKLHTVIGGRILRGTNVPLLEFAREVAVSHHERWDGNGYPFGLKGKDIPLSGMIVAVIDVFDALSSERIYKKAWPTEKALDYIKEQREKQFNPEAVDAFFNIEDQIIEVKEAKADAALTKPIIQEIIDGDHAIHELIERWR
ncbi:MAG TPA: response regulator [Nitrospinota bacterium]|jgi:putative two-component system response regulator|nr:response regulator [Nitrospinota bacterium]